MIINEATRTKHPGHVLIGNSQICQSLFLSLRRQRAPKFVALEIAITPRVEMLALTETRKAVTNLLLITQCQ